MNSSLGYAVFWADDRPCPVWSPPRFGCTATNAELAEARAPAGGHPRAVGRAAVLTEREVAMARSPRPRAPVALGGCS